MAVTQHGFELVYDRPNVTLVQLSPRINPVYHVLLFFSVPNEVVLALHVIKGHGRDARIDGFEVVEP